MVLLIVGCRGSDRAKPALSTGGSATPILDGGSPSRAPAVDAAPSALALIDEMRALPHTPGDRTKAMALHRQAMKVHEAKNYPASERLWAEAARTDPGWDWPYYNLACSTALQARAGEAIGYLEMVRDRKPDPEMLHRIESDGDLGSIRSRPEYEALVVAIADELRSRGLCPSGMVRVPGGTFSMGSAAGVGDDNEHPQHEVTLTGYCIDKTEVTVAAYARCAASGKCTAAKESAKDGLDSLCNGTRADRQDHPVNCVYWDQAWAYCASVNKRLPSEAEWEYAARGGDGRTYPWGNEVPSAKRLNACGSECRELGKRLGREWSVMYEDSDGWEATAPVGSFPSGASPFGALDMAGNVWELTADWYHGAYTADASTNPHGAKGSAYRVYRGGGWGLINDGLVRAAFRLWLAESYPLNDVGFRCARGD